MCVVQVIREMVSAGGKFRVLALSATPGNDLKVINTLQLQIFCGAIFLGICDLTSDHENFPHEN